jgi:hypothetical protein
VTTTPKNTALGRRLSTSKYDRFSQSIPEALGFDKREHIDEFGIRRNTSRRSHTSPAGGPSPDRLQIRQTQSSRSSNGSSTRRQVVRKSASGDPSNGGLRKLTPIPGSPYTTEHSTPPSPASTHSKLQSSLKSSPKSNKDSLNGKPRSNGDVHFADSLGRAQGASLTVRSQPQSLTAALELLASSDADPKATQKYSPTEASFGTVSSYRSAPIIPSIDIQSDTSSGRSLRGLSPPPSGQGATKPFSNGLSTSKIAAKGISAPMPNQGTVLF